MSRPIDLDALTAADRAAVLRSAEIQIAAIEKEQAEADLRIARMDIDEARAASAKQDKEQRDAAKRLASVAQTRVSASEADGDAHLVRAAAPGLSDAERRAEEGLALASYERAAQLRSIAQRAQSRVQVVEPPIYGPHAEASYFRDVLDFASPMAAGHRAATERLTRYATGLIRDRGAEGVRAHRIWRESTRLELGLRDAADRNYRAMTTGSASGGAAVTPAYLSDQYAMYRSYVPAVALACNNSMPLPTHGMQVFVPKNTSGAAVTVQATENTDPGGSSFTSAYLTANVQTALGYTDVSQQLLDRSGPVKFDAVVFSQLMDSAEATVDSQTIAAMIAGATTNLTRATFTDMSSLWSDVNHAASTLETTAGTVLPATHAFMPPLNHRWFVAQVDASKRPIWTPDSSVAPDPERGFTGYSIGSTGVYTDGLIPTTGGNATILVANPASTLLLTGQPYVSVMPDIAGGASTLTNRLRLHRYFAVVIRYAAAAATISGAAYPATGLVWS